MSRPILVRMDDICATMDYEKFKECYNLLKKYNIKPLLAIVPFPKDKELVRGYVKDFWEVMNRLQSDGCAMAVHGYHHVYTTSSKGLVCTRPLSEFSGVPYEQQVQMLIEGKMELEKHGISTDIFCAPGHSYDRNTLKALRAAGYRYITDGRSRLPYYLEGIKCIPADSAYRLHCLGLLTICLHSNEESSIALRKLDKFLSKNKCKIITFQEAEQLQTRSYFWSRIEEKIALFLRCVLVALISMKK